MPHLNCNERRNSVMQCQSYFKLIRCEGDILLTCVKHLHDRFIALRGGLDTLNWFISAALYWFACRNIETVRSCICVWCIDLLLFPWFMCYLIIQNNSYELVITGLGYIISKVQVNKYISTYRVHPLMNIFSSFLL